MPVQASPFKPTMPNYIKPAQGADTKEVSQRIARQVMPTLLEAKGFRSFGVLASSLASGKVTEPLTLLKDIGGVAGTMKDAARANERIAGQARALVGVAAHAKVAGQIGFDLVRARIAVSQAEETVRAFKSAAAESALVFMRPELRKLQLAFDVERSYQFKYREIAAQLGSKIEGAKSSQLGEFALAAEKVASKSTLGRGILTTGKILSKPWIANSLVTLGIGVAWFRGYAEAETTSQAWKLGYGAAAGITSHMVDAGLTYAVKVRGANPVVNLYDPIIEHGAKAIGLDGKSLTIGTFYDDCSKIIFSSIQAVTTGDLAPMNAVHAKIMQGKGSMVLHGYALIGDALSRSSLIDTALTKVLNWHSNVPDEFKTSPSWWSAVKDDTGTIMDFAKGVDMAIGEKLRTSK